MTKKRWYIREGLFFKKHNLDVLSLVDLADECEILFTTDEIDNMIDMLKIMKSYYNSKELAAIEKKRLSEWGTAKTSCDDKRT